MSYMNTQNSSCHLSITYHLKHREAFYLYNINFNTQNDNGK